MVIGKIYVHKGDGQRARFLNKASLEFIPQGIIYNVHADIINRPNSFWIPEDEYIVSKVLTKYVNGV